MFDDLLIDRPDFSLSRPVPVSDQSAHEPDICLDSQGGIWIAWSRRDPAGDTIRIRRLDDAGAAVTLSTRSGVECQPALACDHDETMLCAWVARRDDTWHLLVRSLQGTTLTEEIVLSSSADGLFRPRLIVRNDDAWIVFEEILDKRSRIRFLKRQDDTWSIPQTLYDAPGDSFRPSIAHGPDNSIHVSFDHYDGETFEILHFRLDHMVNPNRLIKSFYRCVQSSLCPDPDGGHWISWSTNAGNRAGDPWWLTKYPVLGRMTDGNFVLLKSMPGRDLHDESPFQGWEFPALVVDDSRRVWIFGQASHRLYAQYWQEQAGGWSERFVISEQRWGSWKPRIRAVGTNPVYIASMGLHGAQVQRLQPGRAGGAAPAGAKADTVPLSFDDGEGARATFSGKPGDRPQITSALRVYFGDLHAHSVYGDAVGDVDELYFRYRDAYGYDFAALTEHDYLDGMQLSRSELEMMWATADRMTVDGEFVAFYGYEWTSPALADHAGHGGAVGEGHRHVLYPDKSGPLVSYGDRTADTGKKLLERLRGCRALVIPHHTAWSGTDLDAYDPELSRLIEICSTHGRFEYPGNLPIGYRRDHVHPGKYVVDALARGQRLGFVGGSDSHGLLWHATEMEGRAAHIPAGTRVGWKEDTYRTGMTAILAPELSRSALFDALYDRRCYATSGVPIFLDFRVESAIMGSEITVSAPPRITLDVRGTADLDAVEIVRQGYVCRHRRFETGERRTEIAIEATDRLLIPGETQYYYARVIQRDGNMAWSSPIWVTYR